MPRELYQDRHPEIDCTECGGAGFFGNGPNVEPCGYCAGTGVVIAESVMLSPRNPMRRETTSDETMADAHYFGGER
jgi:hypothetical protein